MIYNTVKCIHQKCQSGQGIERADINRSVALMKLPVDSDVIFTVLYNENFNTTTS
jgi:hypothetical protein